MQAFGLTDSQKEIWNNVGDSLCAGLNIKHLALQYYLEYQESLKNSKVIIKETDKINNIMRIAYFVSEKNQVTYNMRGEKVAGVALSLNEIIKTSTNFEEFFLHLKEMLKVITIEDEAVEHEIESCLRRFKFTMTFHHKFASTFKKIKPAHPEALLAQSLLWLIFILSKQNFKNSNDIVQVTCLIAAAFIYYVREHAASSGQQFVLDDSNYGGPMNTPIAVENVFLEYFRLKDIQTYRQVQRQFYDGLNHIKNQIRSSSFFSQNLEVVYQQVDRMYQKKLTDTTIDQRHFLKERINNVGIANRFTPFGGRRAVGKNKSGPQADNKIFSHRILNYQNEEESQDRKETETRDKCGPMLFKNLISKTPTKSTPLIRVTPMTAAMEMYNWVLQKYNYHRNQPLQLTKYMPIQEIEKIEQEKQKLISGLWRDICLQHRSQLPQQSDSHRRVLLLLSTQIVLFVKNCATNTFQRLRQKMDISWYETWLQIDSVIRYDCGMPTPIKLHLLGIETHIIAKQLWHEQSIIHKICSSYKNQSREIQRLYKRVIHEMVYQIYFLSNKLDVKDEQIDKVFVVAQYSMFVHPQILHRKSIYHAILCSFYAVSRVLGLDLSFYSILTAFKELNNVTKEEYQELVEKICLQDDQIVDLKHFYNHVFIGRTKQFLWEIKGQSHSLENIRQNLDPNKFINEPVKALLPRQMVVMAERKNKTQQPGSPPATPFTQALLAYNQSPLLKQKRLKNLSSCIDGKRILSMTKGSNEQSRETSLKQTSALISKKWNNNKFCEPKLNSTMKKATRELQK